MHAGTARADRNPRALWSTVRTHLAVTSRRPIRRSNCSKLSSSSPTRRLVRARRITYVTSCDNKPSRPSAPCLCVCVCVCVFVCLSLRLSVYVDTFFVFLYQIYPHDHYLLDIVAAHVRIPTMSVSVLSHTSLFYINLHFAQKQAVKTQTNKNKTKINIQQERST